MAKRQSKLAGKVPVDMTAMIDVVFQLLTFFMLTLKSVVVEGDFNIRMPLTGKGAAAENPIPALMLRMTATPEGRLAGVQMGGKSIVGQELLGELGSTDAMFEAAMAAAAQGDRGPLGQARRAKQQAAEKLTAAVQAEIVNNFGSNLAQAELTELELDCDPGLKYDHVVSAITAASGIVRGSEVVPLIQKIKLSPPRKTK
jgi:biopolymer transport protein ExbD